MTQNELLPLFPSICSMDGLILLVPPSEFKKLEGCNISGARMFMLVSGGSVSLELSGHKYEMGAYSFLDIMEMVTVRIDRLSPDLRAWCLFVTFEFASESLKNLRPGPQKYLLEMLHLPIQQFSQEENDIIEMQLSLLKESLHNIKHYYRYELVSLYFRSFSLELGNIMFSYETGTDDYPPYVTKRDFITLNFMKLVSKHFAQEHNIEFYADALCISSKHLTRIVKSMIGKTPHAVISYEILHQAMTMLEDDNIPVGRISEELHFSDQAAFSKFFKKQMNISPMDYRRKGGNNLKI